MKLYPFKDFDFVGKDVVCLKCYQIYISKCSYKAHIGTDTCVISPNPPNDVYLLFKNRPGRKKYTNKPVIDFFGDVSKIISVSEATNGRRTRNGCYLDDFHQRIKVKEKRVKNVEPHVKKPRGRPRKNVVAEQKKQDQPKQLNSEIANTPNKSSFIRYRTKDETVFKNSLPFLSDIVFDAYYSNIGDKTLRIMCSKLKMLARKFWYAFNPHWAKKVIASNLENGEQTLEKKEENNYAIYINNIHFDLGRFINNVKALIEMLHGPYTQPIKIHFELMLCKINEKHCELKLIEPKNTHMNSDLTTVKGKEYILYNNINENMSMMDEENSTSNDILEIKLETLTEDTTQICTNSVQSHLINLDLNHIHSSIFECKTCEKYFDSVAEWKMHHAGHAGVTSQTCLCKICDLEFKEYKNYENHISTHHSEDTDKAKMFKCKKCHKQYNFLALYYGHIKTHVQDS